MVKVLIVGASSGIGLHTVKFGLEEGYEIRAFARTASHINLTHTRLEKIDGDARSKTDITNALSNIDVVIQTLGIPLNLKLITGPVDLFSRSTEILLPAMRDEGVKRLIALTGFGAGSSRSSISLLQRIGFEAIFGRAYRDKDKQEDMIKTSDLDWTIVRPGVLTNKLIASNYKVIYEANKWKNGIVSRMQVAQYLIEQIESKDSFRKEPVIIN